MVRKALLIGMGKYKYEKDFSALPSTIASVKSLFNVLKDPNRGDFQVDKLENPDSTELGTQIELFFADGNQEDTLLLFFSGHGVKTLKRKLYFSAYDSRLNNNKLIESTALEAKKVHDWMLWSKAKYKVLILDCCFSGAFGNKIFMDGGNNRIDYKSEFELPEGCVVLTSSNAIQESIANKKDSNLTLYTHYLIEGLCNHLTDKDEDGWISADELHEFVKTNIQKEEPEITPTIVTLENQGHKILIAKNFRIISLLENYRNEYRKRIWSGKGKINKVGTRVLDIHKKQLEEENLYRGEVSEIEKEEKATFIKYWETLKEYKEIVIDFKYDYPKFVKDAVDDLILIQVDLDLRKDNQGRFELKEIVEEIKKIELEVIGEVLTVENTKLIEPLTSKWNINNVSLESEKHVDYYKLQEFLREEKWREANEETVARMSEAMGTSSWRKIANENMLHCFPCKDLQTIDQLWVQASQGRYGLSVQQQIYLECGGKPDGKYSGDTDCGREFGDKIGWRINGEWLSNYSRLKWDGTGTKGHLPWIGLEEWESTAQKGIWSFSSIASRIMDCSLE